MHLRLDTIKKHIFYIVANHLDQDYVLRIVLPIVHIATCFPSCQYPDEIYLLGFYTEFFHFHRWSSYCILCMCGNAVDGTDWFEGNISRHDVHHHG